MLSSNIVTETFRLIEHLYLVMEGNMLNIIALCNININAYLNTVVLMIRNINISVKLFCRTLLFMEGLKLNSVQDRSARRHLQMIAPFLYSNSTV